MTLDLQTPFNPPAFIQQTLQLLRRVIAPHRAVADLGERRRAQLLNGIALTLILLFAGGIVAQPVSSAIFEFILAVSIVSFVLGKSKRPQIGVFIFCFSFLSTSHFASFFFKITGSYIAPVITIVPIALVVANTLTNQKTFVGLAIYATLSAFFAPLYSEVPIPVNEILTVGGMVMSLGAVLYGVSIFRDSLEERRLSEVRAAHQELQAGKENLELRVEERVRELNAANLQIQEHAARFQAVSDLSQEISWSVDRKPQELLAYITQIISEKLGFYHVGIFLIDKNRQYAELRAANSAGGQRMLERRHQLKIGGAGIVGYVSQSGYPRIALDTGSDAVFFNNPDLPETRSEMALPLKYGNLAIGVLDVQSPKQSAFSDEDINIFNALANQIALIVQNIQNVERFEFALPSQRANQYSEYRSRRKNKQSGYSYLLDGTISSAQPVSDPVLEKALHSGETAMQTSSHPSQGVLPVLAVPVKLRDRVIGFIHIEASEADRKWTEDEVAMVESISERAALALENARLFEETENRAKQEQMIAQVTSRIGESTNFDRILQTTVQELGRALGTTRAFIQMKPSSSDDGATPSRQLETDGGI